MAKQVRPARHWQARDAPLRRLADRGAIGVARDLRAVLGQLGTLLPADAKERAHRADWTGLVAGIRWGHFREALKNTFARIGKVREAGAEYAVQQINGKFAQARRPVRFRKSFQVDRTSDRILDRVVKAAGDQFAFDLYSNDVLAEIKQAQDDLIQQLEGTARDTIQAVIERGAVDGLGPDEIVDDIRATIGLTRRQAQAVANYRDMLESLDSDALVRQLRNVLEDDDIQAAIDAGTPLDELYVDKLVGDYTDNYLDYRAETIAQTESTRASNAGLQDAYSQAIDRGVFPSDAVRQHWKTALNERVCPVCNSIPDMNPDGVAMDESFESIDGPMDAPPDPHPNCQCSIEVVTDLDQVPSDEEDAA